VECNLTLGANALFKDKNVKVSYEGDGGIKIACLSDDSDNR